MTERATVNKKKLQECLYFRMQLRPIPQRCTGIEGQLEEVDDDWIVASVNPNGVIELDNIRTGHRAKLAPDQIHHFETDPMRDWDGLKHGIFWLHAQIQICGEALVAKSLSPNMRCRVSSR